MFSNSPTITPLGISMSVGPQFCTKTVTWPSWLGTTNPGPPLSSGNCWLVIVAIDLRLGPGLKDPVVKELSRIGMTANAGMI